ncbi:MAG TPA: 2'-5' RNA ligase family protein [Dongiaceae bacterium]|jgi:2'-5' RNA ligase|nr:2'-5' RNA ligase family protein [Dongiaceae bacterium]
MDAQLSFFGAPRRRPAAALRPGRETAAVVAYFAVLPPVEVRRAMIRLRQETVARERIFGRPVAPERLHISIAPLMRSSPCAVPGFADTIEPLADGIVLQATMPAFDVVLDRVQTFNSRERDAAHRRYYLVLDGGDLPGLMRLNDLFRQSLARRGLGAGMPTAFNPHLTLFYANRPIAPRDVPALRWTVRDIALVQSFHGQGRHAILKRWPLAGR